jgi:hypothetical protein
VDRLHPRGKSLRLSCHKWRHSSKTSIKGLFHPPAAARPSFPFREIHRRSPTPSLSVPHPLSFLILTMGLDKYVNLCYKFQVSSSPHTFHLLPSPNVQSLTSVFSHSSALFSRKRASDKDASPERAQRAKGSLFAPKCFICHSCALFSRKSFVCHSYAFLTGGGGYFFFQPLLSPLLSTPVYASPEFWASSLRAFLPAWRSTFQRANVPTYQRCSRATSSGFAASCSTLPRSIRSTHG